MSEAAVKAIVVEESLAGETGSLIVPGLGAVCLAEFIGTFIVILGGDGAVAAAVFANAIDGWGVALMWGLAVTFGIYVAGPISGAHFNPAVTIAMTLFRGFPRRRILPYVASQIAGAMTGAACVYAMWSGQWNAFIEKTGIVVGEPGSQKLMSIFSCFYPSPGAFGTDAAAMAVISTPTAFFVEALMTMILLLMIFALTEPDNPGLPRAGLGPVFIGLTVAATIGIAGSLTMDAINPVRDFGPRLFAYFIGFGEIAFPGPRGNEWWLYIAAPIVGAIIGAGLYNRLVRRLLPRAIKS
ncbi:MAG TPA: MIP/aquaporin family protein [Blastocatellia bacterium]|jgi:glycerol uptake facilitator protein